MENRPAKPWGGAIAWAVAATVVIELATLAIRFGGGVAAAEFNETAPFLLRIHHLFWSLPLFAGAFAARSRPGVSRCLGGLGAGCVASDLLHHFLVLPLVVGNTGWHWP